jgi:hypothetical protein
MTWLNQLLTGKDNQTHDLGRWTWALSILTLIGLAIWQVAQAHPVSLRELAESLGLVSGAGGASLWAKKDTEPTP